MSEERAPYEAIARAVTVEYLETRLEAFRREIFTAPHNHGCLPPGEYVTMPKSEADVLREKARVYDEHFAQDAQWMKDAEAWQMARQKESPESWARNSLPFSVRRP